MARRACRVVGVLLLMLHQHALGQLQPEIARLEARVRSRAGRPSRCSAPAQLAARQVHRDPDRREARVLPGAILGAGRPKHPLAERHDEAVLLGERDELAGSSSPSSGWRQRTAPRPRCGAPVSGRRRSAGSAARTPRAPAPGEASFSSVSRCIAARVHRPRVGLIAAAALLLGLVHRGVGVHQQGLEVLAVVRIDRDADARVDEDLVAGDANRSARLLRMRRASLAASSGCVSPGDDDRELVAAEPGHVRRRRSCASPTSSSRSRQDARSRSATCWSS